MIDLLRYIKNGFKVCSICFCMLLSFSLYSQQNQVISNIIRGSVVGLGWGAGSTSGSISDRIYFDCSTCTDIGNVYLLGLEYISFDSTNLEAFEANAVEINGESAWFTTETRISPKFGPHIYGSYPYSYTVHLIPFDFQCNGTDSIEFYIPPKDWKSGMINYYLLIECLDASSDPVAYSLVLNTADSNPNMHIPSSQPSELSPHSQVNPVGFSVVGGVMNNLYIDASVVSFNNNLLGEIGGIDASSANYNASGVRGHFRYSGGVLEGLDDDTPDLVMDSTDALVNVQSMMSGNSFYFSCVHEQPTSNSIHFTNPVLAGILSYTPLCDTFSVYVPKDTAVCHGTQLPLHVSGGVAYEWYPATGLSCSNCPDPVFSADSSIFYTVKIYNNDSCFVSRPIHVEVFPEIDPGNIVITPSVCGDSTGSVAFSELNAGYSYTLVGGETNYHGHFQNLNAGFHSFNIQDSHGCQSSDTLVFIPEINPTQVHFSASTLSGPVPLEVFFDNTSSSATHFEWFVNDQSHGVALPTLLFAQAGSYVVELVGWNITSSCADTAIATIVVYDSLIFHFPNIFTPNNDGINDLYTVQSNQDVELEYRILNRWGNEMKGQVVHLQAGISKVLWDGTNAVDGVYFIQIHATDVKNEKVTFNGFITLEK